MSPEAASGRWKVEGTHGLGWLSIEGKLLLLEILQRSGISYLFNRQAGGGSGSDVVP